MTDREQHVINYLNSLPVEDRFIDEDVEGEIYGSITRDRVRTSVARRGFFRVQGNPMNVYANSRFYFETEAGMVYNVEYCPHRNVSYGSITKVK